MKGSRAWPGYQVMGLLTIRLKNGWPRPAACGMLPSMTTRRKHIELRIMTLIGGPRLIAVAPATLMLTRDYTPDGNKGLLPGVKEWHIVSSALPDDVSIGAAQYTFTAGVYSGACLRKDHITLQGTGPLQGVDWKAVGLE